MNAAGYILHLLMLSVIFIYGTYRIEKMRPVAGRPTERNRRLYIESLSQEAGWRK